MTDSLTPSRMTDTRTCTCHPDDNPPRPCPRKFSYSECVAAAGERVDAPDVESVKPGDCINCGKEICNDLGWCNDFKAASPADAPQPATEDVYCVTKVEHRGVVLVSLRPDEQPLQAKVGDVVTLRPAAPQPAKAADAPKTDSRCNYLAIGWCNKCGNEHDGGGSPWPRIAPAKAACPAPVEPTLQTAVEEALASLDAGMVPGAADTLREALAASPSSAARDRDTDGELLIDWSPGLGRMVTLSLRADGRLSYAITWDGEQTHGTAQMPAPAPSSAASASPATLPEPRIPMPQALYDEFGKEVTDKVQDFVREHILADRAARAASPAPLSLEEAQDFARRFNAGYGYGPKGSREEWDRCYTLSPLQLAAIINAARGAASPAVVQASEPAPTDGDGTPEQEAFCTRHCCWSGHHKDCFRADGEPPKGGA